MAAFFVALGLEVENRMFVEGEFLDTVIGIPDSRTEIVMLRPPRRWIVIHGVPTFSSTAAPALN